MRRAWLLRSSVVVVLALSAPGGCQLAYPTDDFEKPTGSGGAAGDSGVGADANADTGTNDGDSDACSAAPAKDQAQADFALGQHQGTEWSTDHVALAQGETSGDYVSRVFDLCQPTQLQALEWTPGAPYEKPLPDGVASESGYSQGNIDMKDAALLLHLDNDFADSSANGIVVKFQGATGEGAAFGPSLFGAGFADTDTSRAYVTVTSGNPLEPGTTDFTWGLWVKTTQDCAQNVVYLGTEDVTDARPHFWLGCASTFSTCPNQDGTGRVAGYVGSTQGDGTIFCGTKPVDDGKWHHVALVKQGQQPASIKAYLDGAVDAKATATFGASFVFDQPSQLSLGAFADNSAKQYQAAGEFDDVAIWRRALSDSEVAALAQRGRLRLSFQVRGCTTPTCSDDPPFVGPGNDASKSFVDSGLVPPVHVALDALPPARYVQYRAHFESDDPVSSAELRDVAFTTVP